MEIFFDLDQIYLLCGVYKKIKRPDAMHPAFFFQEG
jgi:hypothetical protein